MSEIVDGIIYAGRRFFEGTVEAANGKVLRVLENPIEKPTRLILPLIPDCHTHVGDYCLRGKIDPNQPIEKIVQPPSGLKHILLSKTSDDEIGKGILQALSEMKKNGTCIFSDFREGGIRGTHILNKALQKSGEMKAMVLGRPENLEYREREIDELLDSSNGIGLSSISDWDYDEMSRVAHHVKSRKKIFSIHASETKREDIKRILDLDPDFIIHMANANKDDLLRCRDADVPIVVCPRSNSLFKIRLDIANMIDMGNLVCLGTDNAMFNSLSMIDEMRATYSLKSNSRQLEVNEVFKLAVDNPQKIINGTNLISISPGNPCNFMVVEARKEITPESLIGTDMDYSIRIVR